MLTDEGTNPMTDKKSCFKIVSVGWSANLISGLLASIQDRTSIRFSHIVLTGRERAAFACEQYRSDIYCIREDVAEKLQDVDAGLLASLEGPGIPTIHNMIMGDRVVRYLRYQEAMAYATYLAKRLDILYREIQPSVVIGGFDSIHSGIGLAVAKKRGIPWYAMNFSTIPNGLSCFCTGLTPDKGIAVKTASMEVLRSTAEKTLDEYINRSIVVPAYRSANSFRTVFRRLPNHVHVFLKRLRGRICGRYDRYSDFPIRRVITQYLRKRFNLLSFPRQWVINKPPKGQYILFALHMYPESSTDTWAPFFSNQFAVIETIARAIPPNYQLLVKLHVSDGDNYSRRQLSQMRRMPGVQLVSPLAQSRPFIEASAMIIAIQGTIALEGALLGKPVLMFGESRVVELPSVTRIGAITELPNLIRTKLAEPHPSRKEIVAGFMSFLSVFAPACYNDWKKLLTSGEIESLSDQFSSLRSYVESHPCATI